MLSRTRVACQRRARRGLAPLDRGYHGRHREAMGSLRRHNRVHRAARGSDGNVRRTRGDAATAGGARSSTANDLDSAGRPDSISSPEGP